MKCTACKEIISPKFVAAIRDNICPACGNSLMSQGNYARIFEVKKQLGGLGFDDNLLFGVSAALASKYTLVPRDLALPENEEVESVDLTDDDIIRRPKQSGSRKKPNRKNRSDKMRQKIEKDIREAEELADIPYEQQQKIIEAYGMNAGDTDNVLISDMNGGEHVDFELMEALNDIPLDGMGGGASALPDRVDPLGADMRHQALLARADQAKLTTPGIKRVS